MCYVFYYTLHTSFSRHVKSPILFLLPLEIQGCGGFSHEETGTIKSDNWPMSYAPNRQCMWRVEVPEGKTITLTFTDFELEAADIMLSSCLDSVVIYDGTHGTAKKYGELWFHYLSL